MSPRDNQECYAPSGRKNVFLKANGLRLRVAASDTHLLSTNRLAQRADQECGQSTKNNRLIEPPDGHLLDQPAFLQRIPFRISR
jgi:hypothetical protein